VSITTTCQSKHGVFVTTCQSKHGVFVTTTRQQNNNILLFLFDRFVHNDATHLSLELRDIAK